MNIKYLSLVEFSEYNEIRTCWNEEIGNIYPISKKQFDSSIINNLNHIKDASFVALYDNQIIGFILGKVWNEDFNISVYNDLAWISLFFVKRKYRSKQIGSNLLTAFEDKVRELNKKEILLGRDTFNFFPGLPIDFVEYRSWFINHGYELLDTSYDMIRYFNNSYDFLPLIDTPYEIRLANTFDKDRILSFFNRCFPGRWEYEAISYFNANGTGREFIIALDGDKVIAFSRLNDELSPQILYNINWHERFNKLSGVGPLGVDREYRKQNLGYLVTATAINEALKRECMSCIIDWTGLVNFYQLFKFEVWKSYDKFTKKIR